MGVSPRGDQVRLSGETNEKPLSSSSSASTAFSSRRLFLPPAKLHPSTVQSLFHPAETLASVDAGNSNPSG